MRLEARILDSIVELKGFEIMNVEFGYSNNYVACKNWRKYEDHN
jgi:hypothetical protein